MSTIADYSVFTKAFLASTDVDFSKPYGMMKVPKPDGSGVEEAFRAFVVVPLDLETSLTPREALNFAWGSYGTVGDRVSCCDESGQFIGNIVRVQPGVREGSIRLVAKVAIPAAVAEDVTGVKVSTFVLLRMDSSAEVDLPIAVATISEGYTIHRHLASKIDPLEDVENAIYVSFTINHLNGYTSVDFNPDAYATYDDVANALSRGIDGLHIAFDTASGDLKLLDKDGNVLDQANLPIKTDVIIADGEEGYKYVKTDVKQDIHAAKAWMPEGFTAWEAVGEVPYTMKEAALVVGNASTPASRVFAVEKSPDSYPISKKSVLFDHVVIDGSTYMVADKNETETGTTCQLFRVKGEAGIPQYGTVTLSGSQVTIPGAGTTEYASYDVTPGNVEVDVITINGTLHVLGETSNSGDSRYRALSTTDSGVPNRIYGSIKTPEGTSTGGVVGITLDKQSMYTFGEGVETTITSSSKKSVKWFGKKDIPAGTSLKYGLEAFVWTVKDREVKLDEPFFQQLNNSLLDLGFHEGDDIALGTNLTTLAPAQGASPLNGVDADDYIHGKNNKARREQEVDTQRANAKKELVAWNEQHPALTEDRSNGTIIDSSGLDVRSGSITLGCGRVGKEGKFQKVNYGIQMKNLDPNQNLSESLDFTISHRTGAVQFDENGHATGLISSTLLSIEAGSYISGAPTCLILAEVTPNSTSEGGPTAFTPVRTTAGFSVAPSYNASSGLTLTIQDYRDNIKDLLNHDSNNETAPSIIEVQAIYTHRDAQDETVPAQQMHTYIGEWNYTQDRPSCSFLCNKIEEWMMAVGLTDAQNQGVKLYVVIRVY